MKGVSVSGPVFFQHLVEDNNFCAELGRVVLMRGVWKVQSNNTLQIKPHSLILKMQLLAR